VQVVDQVVGPDPLLALVDPHAPQADRSLGGGEPAGHLCGYPRGDVAAAGLGRRFRGVRREKLDKFLEAGILPLFTLLENRIVGKKLLIIELLIDDHPGHGIEQRQIGARLELEMLVGDALEVWDTRGSALITLTVRVVELAPHDPPEQHRMGLGGVGADDEEAVGLFQVGITADGFIGPEGGI
jgi:hypothetical protein